MQSILPVSRSLHNSWPLPMPRVQGASWLSTWKSLEGGTLAEDGKALQPFLHARHSSMSGNILYNQHVNVTKVFLWVLWAALAGETNPRRVSWNSGLYLMRQMNRWHFWMASGVGSSPVGRQPSLYGLWPCLHVDSVSFSFFPDPNQRPVLCFWCLQEEVNDLLMTFKLVNILPEP